MKLPAIDEKLRAPLEIGVMLPTPACAAISPTTPDLAELTLLLLAKLGLRGEETLLVSEVARALSRGLQDVADLCRESRVSDEDIDAHTREIGVACKLRPTMVANVRRFVQFIRLAEKLGVVQCAGTIEGRTVLGFKSITVLEAGPWRVMLGAAVGVGYFKNKAAMYDALLLFGYGQLRTVAKFEHPPGPALVKSTDKKVRAVEYGRVFWFSAKKLTANLKRYTNGHTKTHLFVSCDSLNALLAAAREAAGAEKMRVEFMCS